MYVVYDNGRPADCWNHSVHSSWNKSFYTSHQEALIYARKWLGPVGGSSDGQDGVYLYLNEPYDYSGCGDVIEIRYEYF